MVWLFQNRRQSMYKPKADEKEKTYIYFIVRIRGHLSGLLAIGLSDRYGRHDGCISDHRQTTRAKSMVLAVVLWELVRGSDEARRRRSRWSGYRNSSKNSRKSIEPMNGLRQLYRNFVCSDNGL